MSTAPGFALDLVYPAALLAAPFLYFSSATAMQLLLGDGETFAAFLSPWIYHAEALRRFSFPLWTPHLLGGFPLVADPHVLTFHPVKLLFVLLPPLLAYNLVVLSYHGVAGLAAYGLARAEGQTAEAALFAGMAFAFCGFLLGCQGQTAYFMTGASLPVPFLVFRRLLDHRSYAAVLVAAFGIVFVVLNGAPQLMFYAFFFGGIYALYLAAFECERGQRIQYVASVLAATIVGVALTSPQLLPTAELAARSVRSEIPYEVFVGKPFSVIELLLGLLSTKVVAAFSHPSGVGQVHLGALVLLFALFGCLGRSSGSGRGVAIRPSPWLFLAAFTALLYVGDSTPLYRLMFHVPGYNLFRVAARNGIVLDLTLVMLAARGVSGLQQRPRERSPWVRWAALAAIAVVYAWAIHAGETRIVRVLMAEDEGQGAGVAGLRAALPQILLCGAGAAVIAFLLVRIAAGRAATLLCCILSAMFFWQYRSWIFAAPVDRVASLLDRQVVFEEIVPIIDAPDHPEFRIATGGAVMWVNYRRRWRDADWRTRYAAAGGPDVNMIHGVSSISAHTPLVPTRHSRLTTGMTTPGVINKASFFRSPAVDLLNVQYVLVPREIGFQPGVFRGYELVRESSRVAVYRNPGALGFAWAVSEVRLAAQADFWAQIENPTIDFGRTALLTQPDVDTGLEGEYGIPRAVDARYATPDRIEITLEPADDGRDSFLSLSHPHYPGWRAEVSGHPVELFEINGLFTGLRVPAGTKKVVLRYRPRSVLAGFVIAALGSAAFAAAARFDLLRLRRAPASS